MQIITENYDLGRVGQSYFVRTQGEGRRKTYFTFTKEELYILLEHFEASVKGCVYDYLNDIEEVCQGTKECLIGDICDCIYSHIDILNKVAEQQKNKYEGYVEDEEREGKKNNENGNGFRFNEY